MRSRAPTKTTKYKTQSQTGAIASQVSTKPQESAHTPPEARGLLSDITRRGTLSKNQKYCLNLAKIKAERLPQGLSRFSDSPKALRRSLMRKAKSSPPHRGPLAEALSPRPSPERPRTGCQFSDSLEAGLGKQPRYLRPDRTPLTKRHVRINAPNYSRKHQPHAGTVRAERPTGQGTGRSRGYLPLCSSLCSLLTPILPCAT